MTSVISSDSFFFRFCLGPVNVLAVTKSKQIQNKSILNENTPKNKVRNRSIGSDREKEKKRVEK